MAPSHPLRPGDLAAMVSHSNGTVVDVKTVVEVAGKPGTFRLDGYSHEFDAHGRGLPVVEITETAMGVVLSMEGEVLSGPTRMHRRSRMVEKARYDIRLASNHDILWRELLDACDAG